jgi:DNA integrity scanning protein DisA with diadenylate cyclase activity
MILESNILELLIERDTLKSIQNIQNIQNKKNEEIDSNHIQASESNKNILLHDGLMIMSNEEEESSGSIVKQENDLIQKGKNALL